MAASSDPGDAFVQELITKHVFAKPAVEKAMKLSTTEEKVALLCEEFISVRALELRASRLPTNRERAEDILEETTR